MLENISADFIVAGAGVSGVCTAIAAARHGLKVALIHDRPVPGGNCSSELNIDMCGAANNGHSASVYAREGGIVEDIKTSLSYFGGDKDLAFFENIYREENIDLYLNTLITGVEAADGVIISLEARQLFSERQFKFTAPLFADCTGDGFVAAEAGAEFMYGREAQAQFGESLAPEVADDYTMGDSLLFEAVDSGKPVEYHRPSWAYDIEKTPFFKNIGIDKGLHRSIDEPKDGKMSGYWWVEFGGQLDTIFDHEAITLELRKIIYGLWDYIKNSGEFKDMETYELAKVSPVIGKRESRRLVGETILTQADIDHKTEFENAVASAGWEMDLHAPKGIYDEEAAACRHYVAGVYQLPFSMMYSKNIKNLLFAGRNMSMSHVALGSVRLSCQGGAAGQAIGTAAYLCTKYKKFPAEINQERIKELQELLLIDDQAIVGFQEPRKEELYQDLTILASSTKEYSNQETKGMIQLNEEYALVLPSTTGNIDSFQVKLKNFDTQSQKLNLLLLSGTRKENYIPEYLIRELEVEVAGDFNDWLELPVEASNLQDDKLYILFQPNSNLRLYANNTPLTGAVSFKTGEPDEFTSSSYKGLRRLYRLQDQNLYTQICFRDVKPEQNIFSPDNLINPYSRPYGTPNIWISQGTKQPEWIEFLYDVPKRIEEIQLVFNTMLEEDVLPQTIPSNMKYYDIELTYEDDEIEVIPDVFNYARIARHSIGKDGVKSIKINFKENYGSNFYELFAIKLY